jgi:hypothetical protein
MEFTAEELKTIIGIADIAVRANGLQVVDAIVPIVGKCQQLLQDNQESQAGVPASDK